jgi:nucleoside-diphosphate-sugar epimerase
MRVVLTGASGFVGRHVLHALRDKGAQVLVVGRSRPSGYAGEFAAVDLCACEGLVPQVADFGATHLLHLAWYAEHGRYWTSPENVRWVAATRGLVETFCAGGGRKVVVAGTCAEYDWSGGVCREGETPLAPASIYGMAKTLAHGLVAEACRSRDIPWAWGRIFLPYGPGEDPRRLVPSLMDVYRGKREPFAVHAASERDFIYVSDVAQAFLRLLEPDAQGDFNVCTGKPTPIGTMVELIAAMYDGDPARIPETPGEDPAPRVVGDSARLRALGWSPRFALGDVLRSGKGWS